MSSSVKGSPKLSVVFDDRKACLSSHYEIKHFSENSTLLVKFSNLKLFQLGGAETGILKLIRYLGSSTDNESELIISRSSLKLRTKFSWIKYSSHFSNLCVGVYQELTRCVEDFG